MLHHMIVPRGGGWMALCRYHGTIACVPGSALACLPGSAIARRPGSTTACRMQGRDDHMITAYRRSRWLGAIEGQPVHAVVLQRIGTSIARWGNLVLCFVIEWAYFSGHFYDT